ncbi:amino acid ABC transporter permease [Streptococcus pneumoniae 1488]|nr:amino acid ABC transporter permease [Streptococcus pneumoniae 1488]
MEWGYNSFYNNYLPLTPLLFAAFYYLIMTSILTVALKAFEKHMGQGDKK